MPLVLLAAAAGFGATTVLLSPDTVLPAAQASLTQIVSSGYRTSGDCNIKGNVSQNSGNRIYHVPGGARYEDTRIMPEYGERWFCSEAEARAAGWVKARR